MHVLLNHAVIAAQGDTELRQAGLGLDEGRQVLVRIACNSSAGDDLNGLLDRLELLGAELLPCLESRAVGRAPIGLGPWPAPRTSPARTTATEPGKAPPSAT